MAQYQVQNKWGSSSWQAGGVWSLGSRPQQNVVAIDITSNDGGKTLTGSITYNGEGPIGFKGTFTSNNSYTAAVQWGGTDAPWNPDGTWVIGGRTNQNVIALKVTSSDGGKTLTGSNTYAGEGPIDFTGTIA